VKLTVVILPGAKEDIRQAREWYNAQQRGLGNRFILEVRKAVVQISKGPEAFAVRFNDFRACVMDVFPFKIHYSVNEERHEIVIVAVLHTSRNPEKVSR
jgi:plasmid stabilization system protein ParE